MKQIRLRRYEKYLNSRKKDETNPQVPPLREVHEADSGDFAKGEAYAKEQNSRTERNGRTDRE